MLSVASFELVPPASCTPVEPNVSYPSMSFEVCSNPDEVPDDIITALPSSSADELSIPEITITAMHERLKEIIVENVNLKEKLKNSNRVMAEQLNHISGWHGQIAQTHEKYRNMIKDLVKENEKLKTEKLVLEQKLEESLANNDEAPPDTDDDTASWTSVEGVLPVGKADFDCSPCKSNILLQNEELQNQMTNVTHKLEEEKLGLENLKTLLETEKELHDLQHLHQLVKDECTESLSMISSLRSDNEKLSTVIQKLEIKIGEMTQELNDRNIALENHKTLLEKEQGLNQQVKNECEERLLTISSLKVDNEKLSTVIQKLEAEIAEMTQELNDRNIAFEELSKEKEELNVLARCNAEKLSEVSTRFENDQKQLHESEETLSKCQNLLKEKEEELKVSKEMHEKLIIEHTEKLSHAVATLNDTDKKLVDAEHASKTFNEVFETLERQALQYKEELNDLQLCNHDNICTIQELKKEMGVYANEVEKKDAECKLHKKNHEETELTLKKLSEEQEKWTNLRSSMQSNEDLTYQINVAWEQMNDMEGPEREDAWQNLVMIHQERLETVTAKLIEAEKVLSAEQEKITAKNVLIVELQNEVFALSSRTEGPSANANAVIESTFICPCCSRAFEDLLELELHVEECLNAASYVA